MPPRGAEGAALQLQPPQLDYAAFRDMAEVAVFPAIKSVVGGFRWTKKSAGFVYPVHLGRVTKRGPTHCSRNGLLGGLKMAKLRTYGG